MSRLGLHLPALLLAGGLVLASGVYGPSAEEAVHALWLGAVELPTLDEYVPLASFQGD